jgi:hypothetical protein
MSRLCIVPCGNAKIWDKEPQAGPIEAQYVYTGVFATACQRYAKTFFDHWVILSAKHGFLFPKEILPEPYNVSFVKPSAETISILQLQQQIKEKEINQFEELVVLGGRHYLERVAAAFDEGVHLIFPLSDFKGIGYMMGGLISAINEQREIKISADIENIPTNKIAIPGRIESSVNFLRYNGKYEPLYLFLVNHNEDSIILSFGEIERILGFNLPESAYKHSAWWSNDPSHSQAKAWLQANWKTDGLNLGELVKFIKISK